MSTVLQTTVSQLEVARGQRRDHAPNVRAVEPGEAKGNLYLLLELTGPQEGRSRLYRQLLGEVSLPTTTRRATWLMCCTQRFRRDIASSASPTAGAAAISVGEAA